MVAMHIHPAAAQEPVPFVGHGDFAPSTDGKPVDVHVSVVVDRMLEIDDRAYQYEVRVLMG